MTVEVTKIKTGRLTRQQAADEYDKKIKAGMPYAVFTVRVKNDSRERLSLSGEGIASYGSVTYGPEGERAQELYTPGDIEGVSGTILPGKARTGASLTRYQITTGAMSCWRLALATPLTSASP